MRWPSIQHGIAYLSLGAIGIFMLLVWLPIIVHSQFIGLEGRYEGGEFEVTRVFTNSPAHVAGLRAGDRILARHGTAVARWHEAFGADLSAYIELENLAWSDPINFEVRRGNSTFPALVTPRPLTFLECVRFFGVRLILVVILAGLVFVIVLSKPRDPTAFLICLCFCVLAFWLLSDSSYSPVFFSALLVDRNFGAFLTRELFGICAVQLALSVMLHIVLVFPERRAVVDRHVWLLPTVYVAPIGILSLIMLVSPGTLSERLNAVYGSRLWLDSLILMVLIVLVVANYRSHQSPTQREQTKWLSFAVALAATWILVLWNFPRLLLGRPLVPDYDWVLVSILLVPLALTISVTNHQLFGVRRIIRRRIRVLESLLERERSKSQRKDERMAAFGREIEQLRSELARYAVDELRVSNRDKAPAKSSKLARLESRHPRLKYIRETRILGASPSWERVFEEVVLAAHGLAAVLVVGESGTGKSDIAWTVYQLGDRLKQPYREVSCAQFEHADPAFALGRLFGIGSDHGLPNVQTKGHKGLLEECDGGTLFLDDFDRLPLNVQDLLLYPLENKPFEPGIGTGEPRTVSVKFILAVNQEPDALVARGVLRADVVARIGVRVHVPALRDRMEDIPVLVERFTAMISDELGHSIKVISPKALGLLASYGYPRGNVRELKAEIHAAVGRAMLEEDTTLRAGYLASRLQEGGAVHTAPVSAAGSGALDEQRESGDSTPPLSWSCPELEILRKHGFRLQLAERELGLSHKSRTLSNHLRGMCLRALSENDWEVSLAARSLVGTSDARAVVGVELKMRRLLRHVNDNVARGAEAKLFNNLPAVYKDGMQRAIELARNRTFADTTG